MGSLKGSSGPPHTTLFQAESKQFSGGPHHLSPYLPLRAGSCVHHTCPLSAPSLRSLPPPYRGAEFPLLVCASGDCSRTESGRIARVRACAAPFLLFSAKSPPFRGLIFTHFDRFFTSPTPLPLRFLRPHAELLLDCSVVYPVVYLIVFRTSSGNCKVTVPHVTAVAIKGVPRQGTLPLRHRAQHTILQAPTTLYSVV